MLEPMSEPPVSPPPPIPTPPTTDVWDAPPAPPVQPVQEPIGGRDFIRRNAVSLIACAVAVAALAVAISALLSNPNSSESAAAAAVPVTPATSSASASASGAGARAIRGSILSESGSVWMVHTAKGQNLSVTVTPATQFGTPKAPTTASDFAVGANVVITGDFAKGTATATRIVAAKAPNPTSSSPTQS